MVKLKLLKENIHLIFYQNKNLHLLKKLFSNNHIIHLFYCTLILITSYLLWFIYPQKQENLHAESISKRLNGAFEINKEYSHLITKEIIIHCKAFNSYYNQRLEKAAFESNKNCDYLIKIVDNAQKELQMELNYNNSYLYHKGSILNTRKILTDNKINEIKSAFDSLCSSTYLKRIDLSDKLILQFIKESNIEIHWNEISSLGTFSAIAQLEVIKTIASNINIAHLNLMGSRIGNHFRLDNFCVKILSTQNSVKSGEPFKVDLAISEYFSYFNNDYKIYCDGIELTTQQGVAQYQKVFQKSGKQTISATAIYTNSLTGLTETITRDYIIDVLP